MACPCTNTEPRNRHGLPKSVTVICMQQTAGYLACYWGENHNLISLSILRRDSPIENCSWPLIRKKSHSSRGKESGHKNIGKMQRVCMKRRPSEAARPLFLLYRAIHEVTCKHCDNAPIMIEKRARSRISYLQLLSCFNVISCVLTLYPLH